MTTRITTEIYNDILVAETEPRSQNKTFYEVTFILVVASLLLWIIYYLLNPGTLPIRQVRIEGEFRQLSTNALEGLVRDRVKGGFFNINVAAVRDALLNDPWVRDVSVHRVWPDSLLVFVTEQVAVARWGETGLLNKGGDLFVPDINTFPLDLPVLQGPEGMHALMLEKYFFLRGQLKSVAMPVATLKLDDRRAWMFESMDGLQVMLGREDFERRVTRFVKLVPESLGIKLGQAEKIDMRYPNGFAVRWRQGNVEIRGESGAL